MQKPETRIYSICVAKNEVDVIGDCLRAASAWSEKIIVYDGLSDDGTWELVQSMASDRIVPWKQDGKTFQESLRAEVFNAFRGETKPYTWWCHLDADEFYVEDPRSFLARVPWPYHVVWGIEVAYHITERELGVFDQGDVPHYMDLMKYYVVNHSEPRFFRDRPGLIWPEDRGWPVHIGPVYPERLLYRHYQYRSPGQVQKRLETRQKNIARGFPGWEHARSASWKEKIADSSQLTRDDGGPIRYSEEKLPVHVLPPVKQQIKKLLHQFRIYP